MARYLITLIGIIVASASAWAAKHYVPVKPDPVLKTWRWRSYPDLKGLGLECIAD